MDINLLVSMATLRLSEKSEDIDRERDLDLDLDVKMTRAIRVVCYWKYVSFGRFHLEKNPAVLRFQFFFQ